MRKKLSMAAAVLALAAMLIPVCFAAGGARAEEQADTEDGGMPAVASAISAYNKDYEVTYLHSMKKGEPMAGAVLQVLDGKTVVAEWTTDKSGEMCIEGSLTAGKTYTLHEKSAPAGALKAPDQTFTVRADGSTTEVVMEDDYTKVRVLKYSEKTGNLLAGVTLQIQETDGTVVTEWVTDGTAAQFDGLLVAGREYVLHEVSCPDGAVLNREDVHFTVSEDGTLDTVTMVNGYTKVRIKKVTK